MTGVPLKEMTVSLYIKGRVGRRHGSQKLRSSSNCFPAFTRVCCSIPVYQHEPWQYLPCSTISHIQITHILINFVI